MRHNWHNDHILHIVSTFPLSHLRWSMMAGQAGKLFAKLRISLETEICAVPADPGLTSLLTPHSLILI